MKKRSKKPAHTSTPRSAKVKTPGRGSAKISTPRGTPEPTQEQIRTRAYEIYLRRGGSHGHEWEDWIEAERELRGA